MATSAVATGGPAGASSVLVSRALLGIALLAVLAAGWLTWRAQGGDLTASLVTAGVPMATAPPVPSAAPSPGGSGADLVVQVIGSVRRPGVVHLRVGSRVGDAITAAGGVRTGRSAGALNLARRVVDGEQILVGAVGAAAGAIPGGSGAPPSGTMPGPVPAVPDLIDLNTADLTRLDALPGVGPVTAQAILDWRSAHGRFASVDQLREVDGIGPKTYERLRTLVQVDGRP